MGDDAKRATPTQGGTGPPATATPDAGWEARALARVKAHVERLSRDPRRHPDGWEADAVTRLGDYFGHRDD